MKLPSIQPLSGGFALLFAIMVLGFFGISADDAYIVARYAQNFNKGYGIVFNVGEQINALTSPLHFFIFVLLRKLTVNVVELYKIIAAISVGLTLLWVGTDNFLEKQQRTLFRALTLLSPFLVFWTVGGLETPLLLILLTLITVFAFRLQNDQLGRPRLILMLAGLAFLTRYDSVLFLAPLVAYILYIYRRSASVWTVAFLVGGGIAAWMMFSLYYFGDVLPTSFYTKSPLSQSEKSLIKGGFYVFNFFFLSLILFLHWLPRLHKLPSVVWILYFGLGLFLLYGVLAGTKHMMYSYRLFVPFIPVLVLVALKSGAGKWAAKGKLTAGLGTVVIFQLALGAYMYHESQNPNLTLFLGKQNLTDEIYEFSTAGAKTSKLAEGIYRQNAQEIKQHWQTLLVSITRRPRILVLPGGVIPYTYPETYIYETLISYRHYCDYVFLDSADYVHLIYPAKNEDYPKNVFGPRQKYWERISSRKFLAKGYARPIEMRIDIYYQENPAPNRLPSKINQVCG